MRIAHSTQHKNAREFVKKFAKGFCSGVAIACAFISFAIIPTIAAYAAASGRIFSHAGAAATAAYFILPFTFVGSFVLLVRVHAFVISELVFTDKLSQNIGKHPYLKKPETAMQLASSSSSGIELTRQGSVPASTVAAKAVQQPQASDASP
jgi:hypothetical protein